jgi:hypothetical protein
MTDEEMIRKTAAINYEIIITHGVVDGGVGFEWRGLFIHDPFADPQYGAFPVDPVEQYGDAYLTSVFSTHPEGALRMAQQQLRTSASEDLRRYCAVHRLDADGAMAIIEAACGIRELGSTIPMETLTEEQVARVWTYLEATASIERGNI